ncbi:hypothetical protein KP79_PYT22415 [Mizuhopecten yessoensis]|uniref:Ig-like domain-containing protein n=2 Tax=Mizuhopecten yessoensis TaxID=6573 RepID=A0A210QWA1_MIZYE|nr:hypothetical protein KP79_PYT22415 [Mizuhopecten yessoensis]
MVPKEHSESTVLTITSASEEDYGTYDVIVSNDGGQAVIPVKLTVHEEGIPKVVGEMTAVVSNSTGEISATFYSSSSYRLIRWLKQDNEISSDSSKYIIINEDIDIEILSKGETVAKTGTKTRLRVTSPNDNDYGLYSVQIYNHAGMTERSTTLEKECT